MSGHSKWSSIKHKKGAADAKRGKLFSKLSRAIIVAAKEGGPDPDANIALANAVERARAVSMPKDNIERAIARGAGADANSEAYDAVTYEGYGASGAALIVEALTDNRNRTAADVRFAFSKFGGSLGTPGSVAWMFERKGVITVPVEAVDEDTITLTAAEGGAEDVRQDGDTWVVTSEPHDFPALRDGARGGRASRSRTPASRCCRRRRSRSTPTRRARSCAWSTCSRRATTSRTSTSTSTSRTRCSRTPEGLAAARRRPGRASTAASPVDALPSPVPMPSVRRRPP